MSIYQYLLKVKAIKIDLGRDNYIESDSCWLWQGAKNSDNYGYLEERYVHRTNYENKYGEVPKGIVLHHTCFVKRCVNPDHVIPIALCDHTRLHRKLNSIYG